MYNNKVVRWISSLSGFQGGNPAAKIWFCGLEYQGMDILEEIYCMKKLHCVECPPHLTTKDIAAHMKEGVNKNILRIAQAYLAKNITGNIFSYDSDLFKLNLYPLPQASSVESYEEDVFKKTGIRTKSELRSICINNNLIGIPSRFDNFKSLLELNKNNVEVIVCCSRLAIDNFLLAFADTERFYEYKEQLEKVEQIPKVYTGRLNKYYSWCRLKSGVFLFVIPFVTGRASAVKGEEELIFIGEKIKEIVSRNK